VRVRPFNAYGPMQSPDRVIPEIITRALQRQPLLMTAGTQTREFNYVEDLADGMVRIATADGVDGELFNLGCGRELSMQDLAAMILSLLDNPIEPEFGALPERPIEILRMHADVSKTAERIGWRATTSLEDGLARTIEFYRHALAGGRSSFTT
jgi:nucleoside-diphosphate-sugar epimerase